MIQCSLYPFEDSEEILLLSYLVGKLYRKTDRIQTNRLYTDKQILSYTGYYIVTTVEV